MSTQSGIKPSEALLSTWTIAQSNPLLRIIKVTISDETLVASATEESSSSLQEAFTFFSKEEAVTPDVPAYYLVKEKSETGSPWIFYSYVPDAAPVRSKMMYASTRATLSRALGESSFSTSFFATTSEDLTYAGYLSHLSHLNSDSPLTLREQELADIKAAESSRQQDGDLNATHSSNGFDGGKNMIHGPKQTGTIVGMAWSEEASKAVVDFGTNSPVGETLRLIINTSKEEIVLAEISSPPISTLPSTEPTYTLFRHQNGFIFIYCCPATSPIRTRLLYSSSSRGVSTTCSRLGLAIAKRLETSEPSEITLEILDGEMADLNLPEPDADNSKDNNEDSGSVAQTPSSAPMPEKEVKSFARPSRPGRKR